MTDTYDRRSTGRSAKGVAQDFTFNQAIEDITQLLKQYEFDPIRHKLTLLGHSFGGTIALRYLKENPRAVHQVILVNTPISYQQSLAKILRQCRAVYEDRIDRVNLGYLDQIEKMDTTSQEYIGYLLTHSLLCGLHHPPIQTAENQAIMVKAKQFKHKKWLSDN